MQIKENVYEIKPQTEDSAAAQKNENRDQQSMENASTVLGKFKDVDALARAYSALEAEFTRRSQRLKELEKKAENRDCDGAESTGVEKLRKNARMRKEETKQFDEFLREVGQVGLEKEEERPAEVDPGNANRSEEETPAVAPSAEENGYGQSTVGNDLAAGLDKESTADELKGEAASEKRLSLPVDEKKATELSSEELFEKACQNEDVRLKIIGEYLTSIGKSGAPVTAGRGGLLVAPPVKARNINDAGDMALRYFKKGLQE